MPRLRIIAPKIITLVNRARQLLKVYFFVVAATTLLFGGVDYVLCRSLVPFPEGSCPWLKRGQMFEEEFLFPNTHTLWKEEKVLEKPIKQVDKDDKKVKRTEVKKSILRKNRIGTR